jgi:ribosomal protein S17
LMNVYCARQGKNPKLTRFFFDGERVLAESTPESLEMSDGDMVEVHEEQLGGC